MPRLLTPPTDHDQDLLGYPGAGDPPPDPAPSRPRQARTRPAGGSRPAAGRPRRDDGPRTPHKPRPSEARAAAAAAAVQARTARQGGRVTRAVRAVTDGAGHSASAVLGAAARTVYPDAGGRSAGDGDAGTRRSAAARSTKPRSAAGRTGSGADGPARERRSVLQIDPRFRQRWITARREEGARRRRIMAAAGIVVALLVLAVGSLFTPWLAVRHVRIAASAHVSEATISQLSGLGSHPAMITLSTSAVAGRLDALPWVEQAQVTRSWPDTVAITVSERRPVVSVTGPDGAQLVDATGRVLGPTSSSSTPAAWPSIAGAPAAPSAGRWLTGTGPSGPRPGALATGLEVAAAMPNGVGPQVQTITVAASGDVTLALRDGVTTVDLGTVGAAPPGSAAAATVARQIAAFAALGSAVDLRTIARVDLTVPDRPSLTPTATGTP